MPYICMLLRNKKPPDANRVGGGMSRTLW